MTTSHVDRKEIKRPDAFLSRASEIVRYVNDHARAFVFILVLVFASGLGVALWSNARAERAAQASSAFYQAKKTFAAALEKAGKDAADWEEKTRVERAALEDLAKKYRKTRAAYDANLLLGDTYHERRAPAKAADYFAHAVESATGRPMKLMRAMALHAQALALEDAQLYDRAVEALQQALASGERAIKTEALMALARNYELKGDRHRALGHYEQLARENPNTATARMADIEKARLLGLTQAPSAGGAPGQPPPAVTGQPPQQQAQGK